MLHLEMQGRDVISFGGRVTLLAIEADMAEKLLGGARVCNADLIVGYSTMSSAERTSAKFSLGSRISKLRQRLRTIGIDVVTIYGWGLRLEPLASPDAPVHREYPTSAERRALAALDAPPARVRHASLSDFDCERIRNLKDRGFSAMGIATQIRKPYAAIAAELAVA